MQFAHLAGSLLAASTSTSGTSAGGENFPWTAVIGLIGAAVGAAVAFGGAAFLEHRREQRRLRAAARLLYEQLLGSLIVLHAEEAWPGILLGPAFDEEGSNAFNDERWQGSATSFYRAPQHAGLPGFVRVLPACSTTSGCIRSVKRWRLGALDGRGHVRGPRGPATEGIELSQEALTLTRARAGFEPHKVAQHIRDSAPILDGDRGGSSTDGDFGAGAGASNDDQWKPAERFWHCRTPSWVTGCGPVPTPMLCMHPCSVRPWVPARALDPSRWPERAGELIPLSG